LRKFILLLSLSGPKEATVYVRPIILYKRELGSGFVLRFGKNRGEYRNNVINLKNRSTAQSLPLEGKVARESRMRCPHCKSAVLPAEIHTPASIEITANPHP